MKRQQDIAWAQLGIEGVAIVVSILLAFGIEAWWNERQEREEQARLLSALSMEMMRNANAAATYSQRKATSAELIRSMIITLESASDGTALPLPNEQLATAASSGTYGAQRAAYDALVQSGQLRFIENDHLRRKIAGWPAMLEDAIENELQIREVWTPMLVQRLIEDVSLSQVFDSPCEQNDYERQCEHSESSVRTDTEVIGLLVMKRAFLMEAEKELAALAEYTTSLAEMIDEELQSM